MLNFIGLGTILPVKCWFAVKLKTQIHLCGIPPVCPLSVGYKLNQNTQDLRKCKIY